MLSFKCVSWYAFILTRNVCTEPKFHSICDLKRRTMDTEISKYVFHTIPSGQRVHKIRLCNATLLAKLWMRLNFNRTLWYIMCVPLKAECVIKRRILDYWESVALCVVYPRGGQGSPNFQSHKQNCVFNKRTIKVCVSCSWQCPGTSAPSGPHLTVS